MQRVTAPVISAEAGIGTDSFPDCTRAQRIWIPAIAGMTR